MFSLKINLNDVRKRKKKGSIKVNKKKLKHSCKAVLFDGNGKLFCPLFFFFSTKTENNFWQFCSAVSAAALHDYDDKFVYVMCQMLNILCTREVLQKNWQQKLAAAKNVREKKWFEEEGAGKGRRWQRWQALNWRRGKCIKKVDEMMMKMKKTEENDNELFCS